MKSDQVVLLAVFFALYMLPGIIAWARGHTQEGPICVLNLFLGWTGIVWVIALAWSVSHFRAATR